MTADSLTVQVENLSVAYGGILALRDVSIEARSDQCTCLVGRNGAGKSTLLRAIMGLVPPQAGRVMVNGLALAPKRARVRVYKGIAFVPEASNVVAAMTVEENLLLGGHRLRQGRSALRPAVEEMCAIFPDLTPKLRVYAGNLSGGERQMLAIARALMAKPRIILMDEPSFGLSPLVKARVFEHVGTLRAAGVGVLLSEQDAVSAFALADHAYVFERGEIVLSGPPADVRHAPETMRAVFA